MSRRSARRRTRSRGQSLVEFALVLPLIIVTLMGILDFGRGIFAFNTLAESARQANRMAIVNQDVPSVQAEAVAHAPGTGLTAADVDVCFKDGLAPPANRTCQNSGSACNPVAMGCLAIVTSSATFTPITPIISAIWPSIAISSTSVGPIEYVCSGSCP